MRIYKPSYTKPLPEKAKIFSRKGKRFAKFKDAKGHTAEARLTKRGDKILCETEHWHIEFEDNQRIRRRLKGYTNERATKHLADRIQDLLDCNGRPNSNLSKELEQIPATIRDELIGFGLLDARTVGKTLAERIEDFRDYLIKKERDAKYVRGTISSTKHLFADCGFESWSDIKAKRLKDHLDELRDRGNGISKRTYNRRLKAVKHFCKWQAKQLHTTNPIDFIEGLDKESTDQRHPRRAISTDEFRRLLEVTATEPERYRMSGKVRALLYRFAAETGLRVSEIRPLTAGRINFDDLIITVKAAYSKHRREDVQAIRPELAAILKEHCQGKLPAALVFTGKLDKMAEMLKLDLAATNISYVLDGLYFDFHALRHHFGTSLKNVSSRVAQGMMRHSSSKMTDRYTHAELHDERAALETLPDYGAPSKEKQQAAVKTGTDDEILLKSCFEGAKIRSNTKSSGKQNFNGAQKTPLGANNEGSVGIGSLLLIGPAPCLRKRQRGGWTGPAPRRGWTGS